MQRSSASGVWRQHAAAPRRRDAGARCSGWARWAARCARALAAAGLPRQRLDAPAQRATADGVTHVHGDDALVALLPTADDRHQPAAADAGHARPARCARSSRRCRAAPALVNLARGAHVVEADLLRRARQRAAAATRCSTCSSTSRCRRAPFWRHPQVTVLPHVAALTDPRSAARGGGGQRARAARGQPSRTWSIARAATDARSRSGLAWQCEQPRLLPRQRRGRALRLKRARPAVRRPCARRRAPAAQAASAPAVATRPRGRAASRGVAGP